MNLESCSGISSVIIYHRFQIEVSYGWPHGLVVHVQFFPVLTPWAPIGSLSPMFFFPGYVSEA